MAAAMSPRPQASNAPQSPPADDVAVASLPNGGSLRLPAAWTSQVAGDVLLLVPPATLAAENPGLNGICSIEPWNLGALHDPSVIAALRTQYESILEGFEIDGDTVSASDSLRMRFRQSAASDGARLHLFVRVDGGRVMTLAIAGPGRFVVERDHMWAEVFESISTTSRPRNPRPANPDDSPADAAVVDGLVESTNDAGGYSVRHDRRWTLHSEGVTSILTPDASALGGDDPEFYAISSMPWTTGDSLTDPAVSERAAREFLADAPGIRRDGAPERIADNTVLLRCSGTDAQGRTMRLHVVARQERRSVVAIITTGTDATITERSRTARTLAGTLRPVERKAGTTGRADLDAAVVGRWTTDEVMSSGSGFDAGGAMTMVTQRIIDLAADGSFSVGSRSAGGSAGVSFGSDFEIDARGRWSVERRDGIAFIVLSDERGGTDRIRYALHEGQLVLGEPGSRAFWSRMR